MRTASAPESALPVQQEWCLCLLIHFASSAESLDTIGFERHPLPTDRPATSGQKSDHQRSESILQNMEPNALQCTIGSLLKYGRYQKPPESPMPRLARSPLLNGWGIRVGKVAPRTGLPH